MKINHIYTYYIQKDGYSPNEYEDAFASNKELSVFAIADGATEASFSKEWSKILVSSFVNHPTDFITNDWLALPYTSFASAINIEELPWYSQNKILDEGSYSSLAGLTFDKESKTFTIVSIGDSCICWHNHSETISYPAKSYLDFDNSPFLISSLHEKNRNILHEKNQKCICEPLEPGTTYFYMMTDAIAQWSLKKYSEGIDINQLFSEMQSEEAFIQFVMKQRELKEMKNDDVTLIAVEVTLND